MITSVSRLWSLVASQETALTLRKVRKLFHRLVPFLILSAVTAVVLYPFIFVLLTSLKTSNEVRVNPLGLPEQFLWGNYSEAWGRGNLNVYYKNSLIVVVPVVLTIIACSILAGYALSRLRFRGSRVLFWFFIAGMGLPLEAIIIPLYYMMRDFSLLNTHLAVIFPMIGLILPFGILVLTGFIGKIPSDLLDAAKVDGATDWQILRHVVVPIAQPGIVTVLVFSFLWTWNQFFLPTVMLTDNRVRTLPVGLAYFIGAYNTEQHLLAAGVLITAVPVIVVYTIFQRQFIRGLTVGAIK